jgi:uncharacterized protein
MSTTQSPYPQPQGDRDNETFLTSWREGRLVLQSCNDCGRAFFYPRPLCPHCWSESLSWKEAAGTGEIVSFSLIHRPNHPSFFDEVPIVLAEIRVAEGVTLLGRIVGSDAKFIRIGAPVRLLPTTEAGRYPLPTFEAKA